jgi:precorrin-2 dehydrogenase/sirohydrochlorin ferrochelatase
VIAATSDKSVNQAIADDCRSEGILVCRADDGQNGDFLTMTSVDRGGLVLAVSTGGASPTLASIITRRLHEQFGGEWSDWATLFELLRKSLQSVPSTMRQSVAEAILANPIIERYIKAGDIEKAKLEALKCF